PPPSAYTHMLLLHLSSSCVRSNARLRDTQIRQHIHDMRRAFHSDVRSLDEQRLSYATHPDDTVHVNSMLYALVKVLDKATALARTALEHRRDCSGSDGGRGKGWLSRLWRPS
ncbi:hypothetical protein Vretifemale_4255, partial [Volvox reticuliferus]